MDKPNHRAAPWAAWSLAAAALAFAAFCLASLTWDGSYYLFRTLQEGAPVIAHRRWTNLPLLWPLLWARPLVGDPAALAVLHGLLCALLPLASLGLCFAMLRGPFAPLRFWAACGILLAPLPGQVMLISEATPTLQWGWVCLAFVWRGCPAAWSPAVFLAAAAMWGLHPLAAVLLGLAALTAAALGFSAPENRARFWAWAALFAAGAGAKLVETFLCASAYERTQMHGGAWKPEAVSAFMLTPFAAVVPALAAAFVPPRVARWLWGVAVVLGLFFGLAPGGWAGALSYRKFGLVLALPVMLAAGMEAWRFWRSRVPLPSCGGRSPLYPALLFAVTLCAMAWTWRGACGVLRDRIAPLPPGGCGLAADLPYAARARGLDHWSVTSLSLVLQGWSPQSVIVWNAAAQRGPGGGLEICPGDPQAWRDEAFQVGWLAGFSPRQPGEPPVATMPR